MKKMFLVFMSLFLFVPVVNATTPSDVAKIGDINYTSVAEALNAATEENEIVLLQDVSKIEVSLGQNVTINLNGHTVTSSVTNKGGVLTLKGGTINYGIFSDGIYNNADGVLVVDGVTFESDSNITNAINNDGKATIKSITCGTNLKAIVSCILNKGNMTIENGNFYAKNTNKENGVLTINNGSFMTDGLLNSGSLTINSSGYFYSDITNTRGDITINKGTFIDGANITNYDMNYLGNSEKIESKITVNGGEFSGVTLSNASLSDYSSIIINGGKLSSTGTVLSSNGNTNNKIVINGGEITYSGEAGKAAISISSGSLILGTNDNNVSVTSPFIKLNGGNISALSAKNFEFYDGKLILKDKLTCNGFEKMIIPENYYVKYDTNTDSTYTAYLSKVEEEKTPVVEEQPKEEEKTPVVEEEPKEEETLEVEEQPLEENKEEVVENPPTGLYISVGVIGMFILGLFGFVTIRKKNYFSNI